MRRSLWQLAVLFGAADVLMGLILIGAAAAMATGPIEWFSYAVVALLATFAPGTWTRTPAPAASDDAQSDLDTAAHPDPATEEPS